MAAPTVPRDGGAAVGTTQQQHRGSSLAVVSRSSELLACARTALRLAKAEHEQQAQRGDGGTGPLHHPTHPSPLASVRVEDLHLWRPPPSLTSTSDDAMGFGGANGHAAACSSDVVVDDEYYHSLPAPERAIIDATSILRAVDLTVSDLRGLVKRRGHTNDPTEEIGRCMNRFQSLTKELLQAAESVKAPPPRRGVGRQYRRHYEVVATDLQGRAKERTECFQAALAARSEVLKEQAQRRKMLSATSSSGGGAGGLGSSSSGGVSNGTAAGRPAASAAGARSVVGSNASRAALAQLDSPLFTMTTGVGAGAATAGAATLASSGSNKPFYARSSSSAAPATGTATTGASGPSHDGGVRSAPTSSSSSYAGQQKPRQRQQPSYGYGGQKQAQPYVSPYHDPYAPSGGGGGGGMRRRGGHQYGGGGAAGASYSQFAYSSAAAAASSSSSTPYYAQQQRQEEDESSSSSAAEQARTQIQKRRDARDTRARLDSARQAERAIAELGTMFSKMATLVQSQSEVIDNIEDDVEASLDSVTAGSEEIVKLYHITKGNRGLIIKVFALLIFFILFFKLY